MEEIAVFIRGVNVGGNTNVDMSTLKKSMEALGYSRVRTWLNTGNLLLGSEKSVAEAIDDTNKVLATKFNFPGPCLAFTRTELANILAYSPWQNGAEEDPAKRLIYLLSQQPDESSLATLKTHPSMVENFYPSKSALYVYHDQGAGRSKCNSAFLEGILSSTVTARNWNTLGTVLGMMK